MPTADENPSCREIDGDETVRRGRIEPLHDGRRDSESTRPDLARLDRGCNTHALCGRSAPPPARIYTTSARIYTTAPRWLRTFATLSAWLSAISLSPQLVGDHA